MATLLPQVKRLLEGLSMPRAPAGEGMPWHGLHRPPARGLGMESTSKALGVCTQGGSNEHR